MTKLWRYCPACWRLADSDSLMRRCPNRECLGKALVVLPLTHEAAEAAVRIGGVQALKELIVSVVLPDTDLEAYAEAEEVYQETEYAFQMTNYPRTPRPK